MSDGCQISVRFGSGGISPGYQQPHIPLIFVMGVQRVRSDRLKPVVNRINR